MADRNNRFRPFLTSTHHCNRSATVTDRYRPLPTVTDRCYRQQGNRVLDKLEMVANKDMETGIRDELRQLVIEEPHSYAAAAPS